MSRRDPVSVMSAKAKKAYNIARGVEANTPLSPTPDWLSYKQLMDFASLMRTSRITTKVEDR